MGQRPGIQNEPLGRFARLLDPVDELTFMIGLPKIDLEVERSSPREAALLDIRQRVMPVNRWVAHPEQVQIWAVQDKDGRQACTPFRRFFIPRNKASSDQTRLVEASDQMFAIFGTEFSKFVQRQRHVAPEAFAKPFQRVSHCRMRLIDLPRLPESGNQRVVGLSKLWNRMTQSACRRN